MAEELAVSPIALVALLIPLLAGGWYLAKRRHAVAAHIGEDGVQEVEILVRGRYRPSIVVVRKGMPVRLLFNRQEDDPCSERVIFSDFQQERRLAPFATTVVQFIPTSAGEFLFTCAQGLYQGRLLVR